MDRRVLAAVVVAALLAACSGSQTGVPIGPTAATTQNNVAHNRTAQDDCPSSPDDEDTPIECLPDISVTAVYVPPPALIPPGIPLPTAMPITTPQPTQTISPACEVRMAMGSLARGTARTNMLGTAGKTGAESGYFFWVDNSGSVHMSTQMIGGSNGVGISRGAIINALNGIPGGGSRVIGWIHTHDTPYYSSLAGQNPASENSPSSTAGGDYTAFEWLVSDEGVSPDIITYVQGLDGVVRAFVPDGNGGWKSAPSPGCLSGGGGGGGPL